MSIPDFLTVTEAAQVLRIGRTAAYALATRFEQTKGAEGLPVIRIGKQLRVPRARLEQLAGGALRVSPRDAPPDKTLATGPPLADWRA
jgi:Helix-turn-helix domain